MARGRKPEFDPEVALTAIMEVFWCRGYEATTFDDLVRETGVQRYGLYEKIGDKETAFGKSLERYVDGVIHEFTAPLRARGAGLDELEAFFNRILDRNRREPRGCMVCNAVSGSRRDSKTIRLAAGRLLETLGASFRNCLEGASKRGELAAGADLEELNRYLIGVMAGTSTLLRFPAGNQAARSFVREGLRLLRQSGDRDP